MPENMKPQNPPNGDGDDANIEEMNNIDADKI